MPSRLAIAYAVWDGLTAIVEPFEGHLSAAFPNPQISCIYTGGMVMKELPKSLTGAILGALLLLMFNVSVVQAAPTFKTEEPLKFTFPVPHSADDTVYFLLFSSEGSIAETRVAIRGIKNPDGQPLSTDAVTVSLESKSVTPEGVKVLLKLNPGHFNASGEYRIVLLFQGAKGTPTLISTVLINRPVADINLEVVKDQTIELTRYFPWRPANDQAVLYLRESTGKSVLNDLKVYAQNIYVKDTRVQAPGELEVTPSMETGAAAGELAALKLNLKGLQHAGTFDTRILVQSPSLSGEKTIPLKLTVTDFVLWPLLTIALGVLGGFLIRRLATTLKPRNLNTFALLRLKNEVQGYKGLVRNAKSVATIRGLLELLRKAEESNRLGDFAAVGSALSKIEESFDAFRKAEAEAQATVQTTMNGLRAQIAQLENQDAELTGDEKRELQSIKDRLADIESLLRAGYLEDGEIRLGGAKQLLENLRMRKFVNYFEGLKKEFYALNSTEEQRTEATALEAEIQLFLKSKDFEQASEKLAEFRSLLEKLKAAATPHGAREDEDEITEIPAPPAPLPSVEPTHIAISLPVEQRIAGELLTVELLGPEPVFEESDRVRWHFDDIGSFEENGFSISHRYEDAGRYQITAEVFRQGKPFQTFSGVITILANPIDKEREDVLQNILTQEQILSAIALALAIIGGILFLYNGKAFGTLSDYLLAFLWGFGIDNGVKGFAGVYSKISSAGG
jgi:hypothetical protein